MIPISRQTKIRFTNLPAITEKNKFITTANIIEVRTTASEYRRTNGFELSPQVVIGITLIIGIVIALCVTYYILTFMPVRRFADSVTGDIMNDTIKQIQNAGLPVIHKKVRFQEPTLIIKVNGQTKVKMKDPFTKHAGTIFTVAYAGLGLGDTWGSPSWVPRAKLYSTQFSDIWNAVNPGTANITLATRSYQFTDNGTALTVNITFTGISSLNINVTAVALQARTYLEHDYIVIATNLPAPLTLAVNDTIVIQWIVTGWYNNDTYIKNMIQHFLDAIAGTGAQLLGITASSTFISAPKISISNGVVSTASSTLNKRANVTIPNHAYIMLLAYFETSVQNPQFLTITDGAQGFVIFNESVAGLGADRAVLIKIDVSFG